MSEPEPTEFTEREKILIYCLRDTQLSSPGRLFGYDLAFGIVSVLCMIFALARHELALGFVGYALIVGRLGVNFIEGQKWTSDFQSIVRKYEARLEAANAKPSCSE